MKLKGLEEKKEKLVQEFDELMEKRDFDSANSKMDQIEELEKEIALEKRSFDSKNLVEVEKDGEDVKTIADEVRSLENNTEVDISNLEVRGMVIGNAGEGQASLGNLGKVTFGEYIVQKLPYISPLAGACRIEKLTGKAHTIPVQKTKIGKFVKMKELQEYVKKNADYDTIKLEAHKYGTLVVISDECIEDNAYDIESDLKIQIEEGYGETIDELLVKGDSTEGIEGLEAFTDTTGSKKVTQKTSGAITSDELIEMFFALPIKYRKNATWVLSDETAKVVSKLKDADGKPLLFNGYNSEPVGPNSLILGRPIIINDNVEGLGAGAGKKGIFFGDLQKALCIGPRKVLTLTKSTEFGFINDSVAIKANTRLDSKKALEEAMAYYELV